MYSHELTIGSKDNQLHIFWSVIIYMKECHFGSMNGCKCKYIFRFYKDKTKHNELQDYTYPATFHTRVLLTPIQSATDIFITKQYVSRRLLTELIQIPQFPKGQQWHDTYILFSMHNYNIVITQYGKRLNNNESIETKSPCSIWSCAFPVSPRTSQNIKSIPALHWRWKCGQARQDLRCHLE